MHCNVDGVCKVVVDTNLEHVGANKTALCKPLVVFTRYYKDADNKQAEESCFVELELWGAKAEAFAADVKKGDNVAIYGTLGFSQWQDKEGKKRTKHFVKVANFFMLVRKERSAQTSKPQANRPQASKPQGRPNTSQRAPVSVAAQPPVNEYEQQDNDMEIPF